MEEDSVSETLCSLECWTMNEVQKLINLDCHAPLSEAFRIYMYRVFVTLLTSSRRPVCHLLRGAYEFWKWISMPDGRYCLEWREVINLWTTWWHCVSLWALGFMHGSSLWFVSSRQQLSARLAICSQSQVVSSVLHHGAVYFRAVCISVWQLCEIQT
jgi:hypothetical protein